MKNVSNNQFGLIVAYLLPGFIGLAGIAPFVPAVTTWLQPGTQAEAGLGAPLYALLAAMTVGMSVSCLRWLIVDHLHAVLGVVPPEWDDGRLETRLEAFSYLVANHYTFYLFAANTLVAVLWAYAVNRAMHTTALFGVGTDIGVIVLCAVLFFASRDALTKYYARTARLIGRGHAGDTPTGNRTMYNGNHQESGAGTSAKNDPRPKQEAAKPSANPEQPKNKPQAGK
jgi:hypothetical protein